MAHPATLWATAAGAGVKDGTELAKAAVIDPADANDIWTIVNGDVAAAGGTTIKLCADAPVTTTATIEITQDGAAADPFTVQGRTAADDADAQVVLDAGDGAFAVVTLTTADYWRFIQITAQNTDRNAGNDAWSVGANSDYCVWYRCKGLDAYRGFDLDTGASGCLLYLCEGSNNANIGIVAAGVQYAWACIADGNGSIGCYGGYAWVNSVASNNGDDGFANGDYYVNCTAYNNTAFGYDLSTYGIVADCLAVDNGGHGIDCSNGNGPYLLVNYAHYNNTAGAINGTRYIDCGIVVLTADPFTNAGARDFSLNATAGGGAELRNIAHAAIDGNWTSYADLGAVATRGGPVHRIGGVLVR